MIQFFSRRSLKTSVTSLLLLGAMGMLLLANISAVAASSGSYEEPFRATGFMDSAKTNASGWGDAHLWLPRHNFALTNYCDTPGFAFGVAVSGHYAYIADELSGLQVINVTNPLHSALLGSYSTSGYAFGVAVAGGIAYVAYGDSGLRAVNVTNPSQPVLLGNSGTLGAAMQVAVAGGVAYVVESWSETHSWWGLQLFNITNPSNPTLLSNYSTSQAAGVTVAGGIAYLDRKSVV